MHVLKLLFDMFRGRHHPAEAPRTQPVVLTRFFFSACSLVSSCLFPIPHFFELSEMLVSGRVPSENLANHHARSHPDNAHSAKIASLEQKTLCTDFQEVPPRRCNNPIHRAWPTLDVCKCEFVQNSLFLVFFRCPAGVRLEGKLGQGPGRNPGVVVAAA